MTQPPIRVAVVGAGAWGRLHAAKYRALAGAELVAVVDPDRARAAEAAGDSGAELLADARELAGRIDAASVAVPTTLHHEVAGVLLAAGVDVLVEKPITATPAEAHDLVRAARAHGRLLQVGHLERFNPAVVAVGTRVERPLFVECQRLGPFVGRATDVDVVLDLMIHDLDLLLTWVARPVRFVHALGVNVLTSNVDIANARLEFEGGCVASVTASRVSVERFRKVRVFQPSGYLSIDLAGRAISGFRRDPVDGAITPEVVDVPAGDALEAELASFVEAVRGRSAPRVGGAEGAAALELAHRILDAMEEHRGRVTDLAPAASGAAAR